MSDFIQIPDDTMCRRGHQFFNSLFFALTFDPDFHPDNLRLAVCGPNDLFLFNIDYNAGRIEGTDIVIPGPAGVKFIIQNPNTKLLKETTACLK